MLFFFKAAIATGVFMSTALYFLRKKRLALMSVENYEILPFDMRAAQNELVLIDSAGALENLNNIFDYLTSIGFDGNLILKPETPSEIKLVFSFLNKNYALYLDLMLTGNGNLRFLIFNQFYDGYILLSAFPEEFNAGEIKTDWVGFMNLKDFFNTAMPDVFLKDISGSNLKNVCLNLSLMSEDAHKLKAFFKAAISNHIKNIKEFVNNGRIPYHALKYDYYKIKNYIETLKTMNAE